MMRSPDDLSRKLEFASDRKPDNLALLRLMFAWFVIVAHSPELVDGDRRREILTRIFGTLSFGDLAVDGFFLISGFLITKSFVEAPSLGSYLSKRVFRIIPAYMVSFWICVFLIAPFAGCEKSIYTTHVLAQQILRNLMLTQPDIAGCFHSLKYAFLNGSMWTIPYEFCCYMLTALIGIGGAFRSGNRRFIVLLAAIVILLHATGSSTEFGVPGAIVFASGDTNTRFVSVYLVGTVFYLFKADLRLTSKGALISLGLLLPMLFHEELAETALTILGGYLLFWCAFKAPVVRLGRLAGVDISYGVYLYAWPIQSLLITSYAHINPWMLCAASTVLAGGAGYLSWILVEKPAQRCVRSLRVPTLRFSRAVPQRRI